MAHVVNFYLDEKQNDDKDVIVALSRRPVTEDDDRLLMGYVREALRTWVPYGR